MVPEAKEAGEDWGARADMEQIDPVAMGLETGETVDRAEWEALAVLVVKVEMAGISKLQRQCVDMCGPSA